MRKTLFFFLVMLTGICSEAQLVINFQSPPSGITYKPQLWSMVVTNTSGTSINLHIEVTLTPLNASQSVLSGVTRNIVIVPGVNRINATDLMPITYNVSSTVYNVDASPDGLLPMGEFEACYQFFKHVLDGTEEIAEQCQEITAGPLSPPELIYPFDETAIEETHPQFNWLPPVPVALFSGLRYDLTLVEINPNQSPSDALQQNIPIYQGSNLTSNTLLYPLSATSLEYDKHYAWKVVAKSNDAVVGQSEIWQFTLKHFGKLASSGPTDQPYVQLKRDPDMAYAIFSSELKFSYANETPDTTWNITITDMGVSNSARTLSMDSIPLKRGENLVRYPVLTDEYFTDRHLYQLQIRNSRNELWRLRFEYRAPNEPNNNEQN